MKIKKCETQKDAMKFCDACNLMDVPYTTPRYDYREKLWVVKFGSGDGL